MKIKSQFILLIVFIIVIPFICGIFLFIHSYMQNPDIYLIDDYKQIREIDRKYISSSDTNKIKEIIEFLPPPIQAVIVTKDGRILFSQIEEFTKDTILSRSDFLKVIEESSTDYFYQFTSPFPDNKSLLLISRVPRNNTTPKGIIIVRVLTIFFFILFLTAFIIVSILSRNIFKSIIIIEEKTKELSSGNLTTEIIAEKENRNLNEITSILTSLEKMRISLLDAQIRKSSFIMGISHDLRTPVAVIKGYTEALQDHIITDEKEINNSLELIKNKTSQLESMINTLIKYIKLNNDNLNESFQNTSITKLISNFFNELNFSSNVYKRNIVTNINFSEDIFISLNEELVYRIFQNIFSNAIRYTKDNDTIEISALKDNNSIVCKFSDTGIGMEKNELNHIFDLFYRGSNSRQEEGMGIGLAVVKNIIDKHGWTIEVESEKDVGTTFTITIPLT